MAGSVFVSTGLVEARHRSSGFFASTNKREHRKRSDHSDSDKEAALPQERKGTCRLSRYFKVVIFLIICGTLLTSLIQSPMANEKALIHLHVHGSSRFSGVVKELDGSDGTSHLAAEFTRISEAMDKLGGGRNQIHRIGLLNFDVDELRRWQKMFPGVEFSVIGLELVDGNVTWEGLYPEWINEEEEDEESESAPTCPSLPEPTVGNATGFLDLVAVKLPCSKLAGWSRDVRRLQLQLAAAKIVVRGGRDRVHVLFVTECFPLPNVFRCSDLVARAGNAWLYRPRLPALKERIGVPVGSCQLAVPLKARGRRRRRSGGAQREAYVTILHSANRYVCGAMAAAQSIRMTGSTKDLVILVDDKITEHQKRGLRAAGWKVRTIERIGNPKADRGAYNKWNYSKFRLWQLTYYDKLVFIDADLLVLRNIDFLFSAPEISATGNNGTLFNSGVMVVEPSNCTFSLLMDHVNEIRSYNGGDQGYLNEVFTWWHRIPRRMNFLKHFWEGDGADVRKAKTRLFGADHPPQLYVIHYLGLKPWWCFRDYDCNWNVERMREFASDVAHERWWRVHDAMPKTLQRFCTLSSRRSAKLEWDRLRAKEANLPDGHWRRKIRDRRFKICSDGFCFNESFLRRWAAANFTGDFLSTAKYTNNTTTSAS